MPSLNEYNASIQNSRILYSKIELLNNNLTVVNEWSNIVVGSPSFSINADSDIRRTCSLTLIPIDDSLKIESGSQIWLDKYVRIYIGIELSGEIIYTNMGIYLINNPNTVYNATTHEITIQGIDMMAKLTGQRNGTLEGLTHTITAGTNVRTAIIGVLSLANITSYVIEECEECSTVPEDISVSLGSTIYDLLKALRDLIPQYQMYFDVDGVFHYNKIPSGVNASVFAGDELWDKLLLSYNRKYDFESVKNSITVYGKTHNVKYYNNGVISSNTIQVTVSTSTSSSLIYDGIKIGFTLSSNISSANGIYFQPLPMSFSALPIVSPSEVNVEELQADVYYVVKYQQLLNSWLLMGESTPSYTIEEDNPDSPFYVNGNIGRIRTIVTDDNIYTTELAKARAKWELYTRCRLQDAITLTCIPVYWLDVNNVIEITLPNEEKEKYIIKSISVGGGVSGTQTIQCQKYYSYYEEEE